jgi:hypothetical protein
MVIEDARLDRKALKELEHYWKQFVIDAKRTYDSLYEEETWKKDGSVAAYLNGVRFIINQIEGLDPTEGFLPTEAKPLHETPPLPHSETLEAQPITSPGDSITIHIDNVYLMGEKNEADDSE